VLVQELDELANATLVNKRVMFAAFTLVVDRDVHAGIEEGELPEALGQRLETEFRDLEHGRVRLERDLGAALLRRPGDVERSDRVAALVTLLMHMTVTPDLELEPLRQCVHDRNANAVKT